MRTTLPLSGLALVLLAPAFAGAQEKTGEAIYKQMCARCHGATGEGTKKYSQELIGDKSVAQLALVIDKTMPENEPEKLDAADSKKVAEYIHAAFYSPDAQARKNPPKAEFSRLTVRQYRNSIADIIGGFRPAPKPDDKRGLRGEYFNARGFQANKRGIDRIDPEVQFDFGLVGPESEKEKFDIHQFCIRWDGSVIAPETGVYEFVVKTEHALRLWVNEVKKPTIDAWVKSGSDTVFRTSVFLLAGRAYPIKLEFSKAKQGVNDTKKNPNPPPVKASVALMWKRPNRVDEVIPSRFLTPTKFPEVAVIETSFPPDDRSLGWERGTTVSREWDQAATNAALETAAYVTARLPELSGVQESAADRGPKLREFARKFAEKAFRRPLSPAEKALFIDSQFDAVPDPELAVKRSILFVLKSPRFLYPEAARGTDAQAVATRLALTLWDAPPDQALLDAAAAGKLGTREEVAKQAERMLLDPRAKAKIREFLLNWLKVDPSPELAKDAKKFPGFDAEFAADLRTSLELFLEDVVWGEKSDFRQLLLADEMYLNARLAKFYGVELPANAPFQKVKLDPEHRSGLITHPYILATFAYTAESSPIHRGVFVGRSLLGINLRPPQDAFSPLPPELHPGLTTRDRVTLQTKPAACVSCHGIINPLGFTLENFDAVGRYREKENAKTIDVSGGFQTKAGDFAKFTGPRELAKFLANSEDVQAAFVQQLFHHLIKQPVRAYGLTRPEELRKSFAESGDNIRKLVLEIATSTAMTVPKK